MPLWYNRFNVLIHYANQEQGGTMNMKKIWKTVIASAVWGTIFSTTAFAGQWVGDQKGWWYDNGDGTYPSNTWQWIDGNGDSISECYYFDASGYCMMNGTTPDGYEVNQSGAWILNGAIQTKTTPTSQGTSVSVNDDTKWKLIHVASLVYGSYNRSYPFKTAAFPLNTRLSDLTLSQKAYVLYGYQYNCQDFRFVDSFAYGYDYHVIKDYDLKAVITEIFGSTSQADIDALIRESYILKQSNGNYYFNAAGDFGDADPFYLDTDQVSFSMENGRLKATGNVVEYGSSASSYLPVRKFTAYYTPHGGFSLGGYRFDQLVVE